MYFLCQIVAIYCYKQLHNAMIFTRMENADLFSVYAGFRLLKAKRKAPIKIGAMERMMGIERNFNGLLLVKTQYTVF